MKVFVRDLKSKRFLEGGWGSEGVELVDVVGGFIVDEEVVVVGGVGRREVEFGERRVGD